MLPEKPTQEDCSGCNPPEELARKLGNRIGEYRHAHYLSFHSTDAVAAHLRQTSWFSPPVKGQDFDEWLTTVIAWHRKRQRERAEDAERFGE